MTLEQLRIFIAVAEREHVTQAARELNLTQSATSAAVSALEARYDTKLFDRIGRRIALTEAGRRFLVEARAVLSRAAEPVLVASAEFARLLDAGGPGALTSVPWVFRERGSGTRAVLEEVLAAHGLGAEDLDIVLELPSNEAVRVAVESGAGAAVLSRLVVRNALLAGALNLCSLALPNRHFYALKHRERAATPAEQAFRTLIAIPPAQAAT